MYTIDLKIESVQGFLYVIHSGRLLSSRLGDFFGLLNDVSSLEGLPVAEIGQQVRYGLRARASTPKTAF